MRYGVTRSLLPCGLLQCGLLRAKGATDGSVLTKKPTDGQERKEEILISSGNWHQEDKKVNGWGSKIRCFDLADKGVKSSGCFFSKSGTRSGEA